MNSGHHLLALGRSVLAAGRRVVRPLGLADGPDRGGNPYEIPTGEGCFGKRGVTEGQYGPKAHVAICEGDPPAWSPGDEVATTQLASGALRFTRHVEAARHSDEEVLSEKSVAQLKRTPAVRLFREDVDHLGVRAGDDVRAYARADGRGGYDIVVAIADHQRDPLCPPDPLSVAPLPNPECDDHGPDAGSAVRDGDGDGDGDDAAPVSTGGPATEDGTVEPSGYGADFETTEGGRFRWLDLSANGADGPPDSEVAEKPGGETRPEREPTREADTRSEHSTEEASARGGGES